MDRTNPTEWSSTGATASRACRVSRCPVRLPFNTVKHSQANLFAAALTAHGHQCVLEETSEWNMVELVVSGQVVFTCDVKQLEFGEPPYFLVPIHDCVKSQ